MLTGHGGLETAIAALRNGAFDYMTKPIDFDELEINLKRALEKRNMKRLLDAYFHDLEMAHVQLKEEGDRLEVVLKNPVVASNGALKAELEKLRDNLARIAPTVRPAS